MLSIATKIFLNDNHNSRQLLMLIKIKNFSTYSPRSSECSQRYIYI